MYDGNADLLYSIIKSGEEKTVAIHTTHISYDGMNMDEIEEGILPDEWL